MNKKEDNCQNSWLIGICKLDCFNCNEYEPIDKNKIVIG